LSLLNKTKGCWERGRGREAEVEQAHLARPKPGDERADRGVAVVERVVRGSLLGVAPVLVRFHPCLRLALLEAQDHGHGLTGSARRMSLSASGSTCRSADVIGMPLEISYMKVLDDSFFQHNDFDCMFSLNRCTNLKEPLMLVSSKMALLFKVRFDITDLPSGT
jgi:hypothetical protein